MEMPDFDERLLTLCDDLWAAGERKHGAFLFLSGFTGFGTERAYETLNALRGVRADREAVERLQLGSRLANLINQLEEALDEPLGVIRPPGGEF